MSTVSLVTRLSDARALVLMNALTLRLLQSSQTAIRVPLVLIHLFAMNCLRHFRGGRSRFIAVIFMCLIVLLHFAPHIAHDTLSIRWLAIRAFCVSYSLAFVRAELYMIISRADRFILVALAIW